MAKCCDETGGSPLELLPAGLGTLPRQLRAFPDVRRDLLAAVAASGKPGLGHLRPSRNDFGLMWLEMWAYVADVLGFYDARVADAVYLGTAADRQALRRLVGLLGYSPAGGVAGRVEVAVLAKGRAAVQVSAGTAFRSRGFAGQPPQVFESDSDITAHPLKNSWRVDPFVRRPTVDAPPLVFGDKNGGKNGGSEDPYVRSLLFRTAGFGLSAESLVLVESREPGAADAPEAQVTRVLQTAPFPGADGVTYMRATFEPAIRIPKEFDLEQLRVRRPVQSLVATSNAPIDPEDKKGTLPPIEHTGSTSRLFVDGVRPGLRRGDALIVARRIGSPEPQYQPTTVLGVELAAARVTSIPGSASNQPVIPATLLELTSFSALGSDVQEHTFHFDFVDAGTATNVGRLEVGVADLTDPEGVPLAGVPKPPPEAKAAATAQALSLWTETVAVIEQVFLFKDAADRGGRLDGRITFSRDGRASFQALVAAQIPPEPLRLPLTLYGNIVSATRGERIVGEILGSGDARATHQKFLLKKKPLTYLPVASPGGNTTSTSTLEVFVNGVKWREAPSFFGASPDDRVYIVRHDDEQNTLVTFGDGALGARLPSGVKNVVANYRFGAGFAAPPAGAVTQLAAAVSGIDGVVSPMPASPGKDPEAAGALREAAPRRALLLGRIVSVADYEAVAANAPGVIKAVARWLWIESQMQAGVQLHYIGEAEANALADALRQQADPSVPLAVTRAKPISAQVDLEIEVDPRYVKTAVAEAVVAHLCQEDAGVLAPGAASIGGTFWPSRLYEAIAQVPGVLAVGGISFVTPAGAPQLSSAGPTCLPSGYYLDFTAQGAVRATGVDAPGTPLAVEGAS